MKIEQGILPPSAARPCRKRTGFRGVTLHETANYKRSADAKSHGLYMAGNGKNKQVSAHYYVDDAQIIQCIPEEEVAWHAGDGVKAKGGNLTTIAIEICENWGYLPPEYAGMQTGVKGQDKATEEEKTEALQRFTKAIANAITLTATILHRHGIRTANGYVWQHNHWSGKDCPHNIRQNLPFGWGTVTEQVQNALNALWNGENPPAPPSEETATGAQGARLYRVQVGAFASKENAEKMLAQLQQKGFAGILKQEENP